MSQSPLATAPLAGRTCLVTGASMGVGQATAVGLARLGARVITASRHAERGEAAATAIARASGSARVAFRQLDLTSLADVERFASAVLRDEPRLDILVNNASVITRERAVTVDGLETQFAVNHVAPVFLTRLLRPLLAQSPGARIVTVASQAHRGVDLEWADLQAERVYRPTRTYQRTKLANILFTRELALRLAGAGEMTTANCLHPGVIHSELLTNFFPGPRILQRLASRLFGTTPERGARTSLHVATSPDLAAVSGAYFVRCRETRPSGAAESPAAATRLWEVTEQLIASRTGGRSGDP